MWTFSRCCFLICLAGCHNDVRAVGGLLGDFLGLGLVLGCVV